MSPQPYERALPMIVLHCTPYGRMPYLFFTLLTVNEIKCTPGWEEALVQKLGIQDYRPGLNTLTLMMPVNSMTVVEGIGA